MINLERAKERFKNHVAKFTDYGNIKILDFKDPKSITYRIRFLFEEDYYRLHISGDLGELIATNYSNMTYEGFSDFIGEPDYFAGKIYCMNRDRYVYDEDKARKDLLKRIEEEEKEDQIMSSGYDSVDEFIDDVMWDFENAGLGYKGKEVIDEVFGDSFEWIGEIGKEDTGIIDLYLMAFDLAMKDLKSRRM